MPTFRIYRPPSDCSNSTKMCANMYIAPREQSNMVCAQHTRVKLRTSQWFVRYSSYKTNVRENIDLISKSVSILQNFIKFLWPVQAAYWHIQYCFIKCNYNAFYGASIVIVTLYVMYLIMPYACRHDVYL